MKPMTKEEYLTHLKDVIFALRTHGSDLKNHEAYRKKWLAKSAECSNPQLINSFSSEDKAWIEQQLKEFIVTLKG